MKKAIERPNILLLMSDEHRADVVGYEGNNIIRTPILNELARTGVVFRNAYTPSPICIPARQCIMSGQFPRTCGVEHYGEDLPPNSMTYARHLAQYGYNTVVSGKLHHMGTDQMQGWTRRICGDIQIDRRFIGEREEKYVNKQNSVPSQKWSDAKEISRAGIGRGPCIEHDEFAIEGAIQFINEYFNNPYYDREQNQPLLLKVSLLQPHYPYLTDEKRFNYYLNRVQPFLNEEISEHPFLMMRQVRPEIDASVRELRRATAAYYGMIETIDFMYGRVLEALHHAGQNLDDWIIIYTSDHGEMLGEHGVWEKQKFYEASVRVPLIIRWPSHLKGEVVMDENVNLCDLFATLCEMTGVPIPKGIDSRSLHSLILGNCDQWDNETISQFGGRNIMIKREQLKYQYYGPDQPEVLFDLKSDPREQVNVVDEPYYENEVQKFRFRAKELGFPRN